MFGYIPTQKPELKIREFTRYQGYYCGLCRSLRLRYGLKGSLALNYDMVFLAALLTGLYEGKEQAAMRRCVLHPYGKHLSLSSEYVDYAADMTILLAYHNLMDDWLDEKKLKSLLAAGLLKGDCRRLKDCYPRQWRSVTAYLEKLHAYEQSGGESLDAAAGFTGDMLGELFVYQEDCWAGAMRRFGFYLGKFVYLMDAYEDLEKDRADGTYNPLLSSSSRPDFEDWMKKILTMMMAECAAEFERLPVLKDLAILRNILYAGVWTKYDLIHQKRTGENHGPL